MLLQLEIFVFFTSFIYITYYFFDTIFDHYKTKLDQKREVLQKQKLRTKQKKHLQETSKKKQEIDELTKQKDYVSPQVSEQLREISKRAQVNISRWYLESARSLIIEWLALKKEDKDLNLLLADIYEREKKFQNAEYIYRDLLDENKEDEYILQRLWNIYALREKNKKAISCYSEALKSDRNNTEILDILAHLCLADKDYKKSLKYAWLYLKEKPWNAEKLSIKWYTLEKLWKSTEAIKAYNEVLQLQPYNSEIQDRIKSLESK